MKKQMSIFLVLMMSLLLTCCQERASTVDGSHKPLIKVGFSQTGSESVWRVTNTNSVKDALSEKNGYELIYDDAQQNQENQIRAIRKFIQQNVDYIVLAPLVESGWDSVLEEAKKAGIPVIIEDRNVSVNESDLYSAYVGGNFLKEGETAVSWLDSVLKQQGRDNDKIQIVDIQGTIGSTAQIGRTAALETAIGQHSNWVLAAQQSGDFIKPKAYEAMKNILIKTQKVDVVYCENDSEAFGAIQALQEAGLKCGAKDGVIVISFDATSEGLTNCLSGTISLDVECNPLQGPYIAKIIQNLRQGKSVDRISYIDETSFDCFSITKDTIKNRDY